MPFMPSTLREHLYLQTKQIQIALLGAERKARKIAHPSHNLNISDTLYSLTLRKYLLMVQ